MLGERDRLVVQLVGRLGQMTPGQLQAAAFAGCASRTPVDRCLKRLVEGGYLLRIPRLVGGNGGGSEQYVYALGEEGLKLERRARKYRQYRTVNAHTLDVADCYVALEAARQAGELTTVGFVREPHRLGLVHGTGITPDAHVELGIAARNLRLELWLELDRATEWGSQIKEKCVRYWQAWKRWPLDTVFPYVAFVVPDDERKAEIVSALRDAPEPARAMFKIETQALIHRLWHNGGEDH